MPATVPSAHDNILLGQPDWAVQVHMASGPFPSPRAVLKDEVKDVHSTVQLPSDALNPPPVTFQPPSVTHQPSSFDGGPPFFSRSCEPPHLPCLVPPELQVF